MSGGADVTLATGDLDELRARLVTGAPPTPVAHLPGRVRRTLALALDTGSPAVAALDAAVAGSDSARERARVLRIASAQARTVSLGMVTLPVVALPLLGRVLEEPLWRFYATPPGALVGTVGAGLAVAGLLTIRRITRRVGAGGPPPLAALALLVVASSALLGIATGLLLAGVLVWRRRRAAASAPYTPGDDEIADLVATALEGGCPPPEALRLAGQLLPDHATELNRGALALELALPTDLTPAVRRTVDVVRIADTYGTPAAPALRRLGHDLRAEELARAREAAERLPALLAFPTALFLLPAAVLLVGAPLLAVGLAAANAGT